ncbi:MAG: cytochrome c biogenesis protein CcsA [Acidobacteriia bacterium]|nr:cytochrome c biogenesis protein CcsA [Terriglobia bacterium]
MRGAKDILTAALFGVIAVLMLGAVYLVFVYAPEERVMGPVQRIFYFHVPSAIVTFTSVMVLLAASITYLATRRAFWDNLARAATEIGLLFCTVVLVTGPIWAKPAWGVWWTWEARLTTTLVLWLILAGCLMVRGYAENRDQGARLAAVLGIVAALDVPIVYKAVDWWRGQHPVVFGPGKQQALAPEMHLTFRFCLFVFLLLFALLLTLRTRVATLEDRARSISETLEGR